MPASSKWDLIRALKG